MSAKNYLLLLFSTFISSISAQEVSFYATSDARQIVAGNYFQVTFTLENGQGDTFRAPNFANFEIMSGPNRSSQISIINGRKSEKMSFTYGLTSKNPGKHKISTASIKVDGKTYFSDPIEIEVLYTSAKGSTPDPNAISATDFIIEAEISSETAYIGQQVTLKYVLYTTKDVRSYNFVSLPNFDGFFAQEIQGYRDRQERVIKNGIQYVSRTLKVISLFPQQKGTFAIDPAVMTLGISTQASRTSFFFNSNLKPVRVESEAKQIKIIDLPLSAPKSFAGAVGDFYMGSAIDKKSLAMDDAVTLTYQIKGDGDSKLILAPDQPFTDLFDIYEPNLLAEESNASGEKIVTTKTFEYLMIPKKEGVLTFRPELSFFNVESNRYVTIEGETYQVNVTPSTGRQNVDISIKEVELPPIYTATKFEKKDQFFFLSTPYWIANGTLGLGLIGLLIVKKIQLDREKIDPAQIKNSKAKKMAIAQLSSAKKAWDSGNTKEFYIQLRKGLLEYLASKTYQSSAQMSKNDISKLLNEQGLAEMEEDVITIMQKGEMAIYANMTPGDEENIYQKAINLIEKVETTLKK
jgi:hypothetical protein